MGLHLGSGRRVGHEGAGSYQEVCPVCRELRRIAVTSWFTTGYVSVQFIPIPTGGKQHEIYVAQCGQCGSRWVPADFERLRRESRGAAEQRCSARLRLEEKVRAGTLSEEERRGLVYEPFPCLSQMPGLARALKDPDSWTNRCIVATLLLVMLSIVAIAVTGPPKDKGAENPVMIAATLTIWPAIFLALGAWFTRHRRYLRREVYPRLARALKPLRPSPAEIEAAVERLRAADPKAAKGFNAAAIHERIELG